jgi:NADPH:quinone reductase-like Zn-dependent oxidoreductase
MESRKVRIHRFGGPEVLGVEEIESSMPDAQQLLISTKAASVNPVDYKIRNGQYPAVNVDRLPYTLGRDVSGIVEKCGAQATRFSVGDEVVAMVGIGGGGYAEKVVLDQAAIARKPKEIDHAHATAVALAGQTAWQGLFRYGRLKAGQAVLIHGGAGGVGHLAVQFAKAKGARVITTVATDDVQFARALGADSVIDYKTQRFEELTRDLDMVFDLVDGDTRERSWGVLKKGGILVTTLTDPSPQAAAHRDVRALRYTVEPDGTELAEILSLVASGWVKPHIQETFPLDKAAEALERLERGGVVGKIVLTMGE